MGRFDRGESSCLQGSSAPQVSYRSPTGWGQWVRDRWVHTCPTCRLALWRERFETQTPAVEIPLLICKCEESPEIREAFEKVRLLDEEAHTKWEGARTNEETAEASRLLREWSRKQKEAEDFLMAQIG